jgi:hypothetical protein
MLGVVPVVNLQHVVPSFLGSFRHFLRVSVRAGGGANFT